MNLSKTQLAVLALIVANVIWGAALPIYKWALHDIHPATFGYLRFIIANGLLLPFVYKDVRIHKNDIWPLIGMSLVGITGTIGSLVIGLQYATSINASVISSAGPIFLVIASIFYLHEKVKARVTFGTIISLIGILLFVIRPVLEHGFDSSVFGNLMFIVNTVTNVIYTIMLRKMAVKYKPLALTFWTFLIGGIGFLPFFLIDMAHTPLRQELHFEGLIGLAFAICFSAILAYYLYIFALKHMVASKTGVFMYLDPVVTVLVAWPLLGERVTLDFMIGSMLVFAGIFIAEQRLHWHPLHLLKRVALIEIFI